MPGARRFCWILVAACLGCGSDNHSALRKTVNVLFEDAVAAQTAGDAQKVAENLTQAIDQGGLDADRYEAALRMRAIARARTGDLEGAQADLTALEQGATDMAQFHLAQSFVLSKKGDAAGASRALQQARRLDPRIKPLSN